MSDKQSIEEESVSRSLAQATSLFETTPLETEKAILLQRTMRAYWNVYENFGSSLFVDSQGTHANCGTIAFDTSVQASWINVSDLSHVKRLSKLLTHFWKLPPPHVIISVTGSAGDCTLGPELTSAFRAGLAAAAVSASAWIFTGGADVGVSKLVGDTMQQHNVHTPVIGVLPWGALNSRHMLASNSTIVYPYSSPTSEGVPINPNHTHFVFVDNGTEGADSFGTEAQLRSNLQKLSSMAKGVPLVQLLVEGGPEVLTTLTTAGMLLHLHMNPGAWLPPRTCRCAKGCGHWTGANSGLGYISARRPDVGRVRRYSNRHIGRQRGGGHGCLPVLHAWDGGRRGGVSAT